MRLSVKVWPQNVAWQELRDFWAAADEIPAYHAGWLFDHFVPQTGWRNHEPLRDPDGPCYEAWTLLSYLAAVTSRLRLGTLVTSATHRHPAVFAKVLTTLDTLSGGRVEVGVGAGWNEAEHARFGIPYPPTAERFDRFEEYLEVLDRLLAAGESSYAGEHYRLDAATCVPSSVQRPRPPFTIGGKGPRRALPIVARWAEHWNYPGGDVDEFAAALAALTELRDDAGRSMDDLDVSVQVKYVDIDDLVRTAHGYVAAGARHLVVRFPPPLTPEPLELVADRLQAEFGAVATEAGPQPSATTTQEV